MRTVVLLAAGGTIALVLLLVLRGESDPSRRGSAARDAPPTTSAPEPPPGSPAPEPVAWRGRAVDEGGEPVAGASVTGQRVGEEGFAAAAETGADGRFVLRAEPGGTLSALVGHPGYQWNGAWLSPHVETVIVLARGAPVTVVVLGPDRAPLPSAQVFGESVWRRGWSVARALRSRTAGTDAQGRASLGGHAEGELEIRVSHESYPPVRVTHEIVGLKPVERVVVLQAGGAVTGRVFAPSGDPVAGARVRLLDDEARAAVSGEDGGYRLEGLGDGGAAIVAEAEGYGPGTFGAALGWDVAVPVRVRPGETVRGIDLHLTLGATVTGRVVDLRGEPVGGVAVHFHVHEGMVARGECLTGEDGRFTTPPAALPAKSGFTLVFRARGHDVGDFAAGGLAPGGRRDIGDVRASEKGRILGKVLLGGGAPATDGTVLAGGALAPIGATGEFELAHVASGEVSLVVALSGPEGGIRHGPKLTLEPGATLEGVVVRLDEDLAIAGKVVTAGGQPRSWVVVTAVPAGATPPYRADAAHQAMTAEDGGFRLEGLPPGDYLVGLRGRNLHDGALLLAEVPPAVRVRAGDPEFTLVVPSKRGVIQGRVLARVDGRPVRAFSALFLRYTLFFPSGEEWSEFASGDGAFRHEVEGPGTWAVEIEAKGYAPLRTESFELKAGETRDLGEFRLGEAGRIEGRVRDAAGAPVAFARVHVLSGKFETNWNAPFTDLDGRFEAPGIAPGRYTVFLVSPRHPLGVVQGVKVEEGAAARVDVSLLPAAPLTVVVRDEGGRPVEGAEFSCTIAALLGLSTKMLREYEPPGFGAHHTGPDGTLLKPCLPPGEVTVTLEKEGYRAETRVVTLEPGVPNRVEVRLVPDR